MSGPLQVPERMITALAFKVLGTAEVQEVSGQVSIDGAQATVALAIRHVEFNTADGTDEAVKAWTELWAATVENNDRLRVTDITRDGVSATASRLLYPLAAEVGGLVVLQPVTHDLRVEPRPAGPRDARNLEAEQREEGWRMSWQKSGENPDDHPPPDDVLDPKR